MCVEFARQRLTTTIGIASPKAATASSESSLSLSRPGIKRGTVSAVPPDQIASRPYLRCWPGIFFISCGYEIKIPVFIFLGRPFGSDQSPRVLEPTHIALVIGMGGAHPLHSDPYHTVEYDPFIKITLPHEINRMALRGAYLSA
jgi:hypothetical protein